MTNGIKCAAYIATAGSGVLIVASLLVMASLFREVNEMYYEVITEIDGFKVLANDAWKDIMAVKATHQPAFNFESIFRPKRQYDAGVTGGTQSQGCQCAAQASSCPAGPPGPPGTPGQPGQPVFKTEIVVSIVPTIEVDTTHANDGVRKTT
ncbi:hypothetical protein QR680_015812 [Steinernema hermaphroditum]|uniref:Nematode cuticle collagen N-terminal domain-containing protein n=1 Tax=Steinernema hermaphroditum TaxID=289476 RepID=A0AA39H913_9BILA|nr:hypothetical protein QR680_015812 [Steinernema hermaphroditum]